MRKNSAFSLIELSIVILIIGILVAGITQSSRLVTQFKLRTARNLTQSSPVAGISGLSLWLETTSEKSFKESETDNNGSISAWYDINPQTVSPLTLSQGTTNNQGIYQSSGINGLPSLKFDGAANSTSTYYNSGSGTVDMFGTTSQSTIFIVFTPTTLLTSAAAPHTLIREDQTDGTNTVRIDLDANTGSGSVSVNSGANKYTYAANSTVVVNTAYVFTVNLLTGSPTSNTVMYRNGGTALSLTAAGGGWLGNSTGVSNAPAVIHVGSYSAGNYGFYGLIGEIIVFNRKLRTEERQSVEAYLGKKWGIVVQ